MIIGGDKTAVVKNIRKNIKAGNLNAKVEVGDPVFSDEEAERAIKNLKDFMYGHKNRIYGNSKIL